MEKTTNANSSKNSSRKKKHNIKRLRKSNIMVVKPIKSKKTATVASETTQEKHTTGELSDGVKMLLNGIAAQIEQEPKDVLMVYKEIRSTVGKLNSSELPRTTPGQSPMNNSLKRLIRQHLKLDHLIDLVEEEQGQYYNVEELEDVKERYGAIYESIMKDLDELYAADDEFTVGDFLTTIFSPHLANGFKPPPEKKAEEKPTNPLSCEGASWGEAPRSHQIVTFPIVIALLDTSNANWCKPIKEVIVYDRKQAIQTTFDLAKSDAGKVFYRQLTVVGAPEGQSFHYHTFQDLASMVLEFVNGIEEPLHTNGTTGPSETTQTPTVLTPEHHTPKSDDVKVMRLQDLPDNIQLWGVAFSPDVNTPKGVKRKSEEGQTSTVRRNLNNSFDAMEKKNDAKKPRCSIAEEEEDHSSSSEEEEDASGEEEEEDSSEDEFEI